MLQALLPNGMAPFVLILAGTAPFVLSLVLFVAKQGPIQKYTKSAHKDPSAPSVITLLFEAYVYLRVFWHSAAGGFTGKGGKGLG